MSHARVKIVSDGTPEGTKVTLGDRELQTTYVKFEVGVDGRAKCELHLFADEFEYDGHATFRLPDDERPDESISVDGALPLARGPSMLAPDARAKIEALLRASPIGPILLDSLTVRSKL